MREKSQLFKQQALSSKWAKFMHTSDKYCAAGNG
jgi:hypothetical protein